MRTARDYGVVWMVAALLAACCSGSALAEDVGAPLYFSSPESAVRGTARLLRSPD